MTERSTPETLVALPRRDFLRKTLLLAIPVAAAAALPLGLARAGTFLSPTAYNPPSRDRGPALRNVRDYGARGDDATDDTNAIQNAINSLPADGGTVDVPAGIYLIDAVRSVNLRSRVHLRLASGALLKARGNSAEWSQVLNLIGLSDVEISGGQIEGERHRHNGSGGQWGHGINIRGCNRVTVRDILLRDCWGDGIWVGSTYASRGKPSTRSQSVVVANIISTGNRRQGMSISQVDNIKVYDSEFCYTSGIFPGCGIDIEPDVHLPGTASNVLIDNCSIHHNHGNGIQVYKEVQNTTIRGCVIERNNGYGVMAIGARTGTLSGNRIRSNSMNGSGIRSACSNWQVSGNTFYNNALRFRDGRDLAMISPAYAKSGKVNDRHTQISTSTNINVGSNYYQDR